MTFKALGLVYLYFRLRFRIDLPRLLIRSPTSGDFQRNTQYTFETFDKSPFAFPTYIVILCIIFWYNKCFNFSLRILFSQDFQEKHKSYLAEVGEGRTPTNDSETFQHLARNCPDICVQLKRYTRHAL